MPVFPYQAGDVVILDFAGATGVKRRPAVILSSDLYHSSRPDVIVALITSQIATATLATDAILQDWAAAGLSECGDPSSELNFSLHLAHVFDVSPFLSEWYNVERGVRRLCPRWTAITNPSARRL